MTNVNQKVGKKKNFKRQQNFKEGDFCCQLYLTWLKKEKNPLFFFFFCYPINDDNHRRRRNYH